MSMFSEVPVRDGAVLRARGAYAGHAWLRLADALWRARRIPLLCMTVGAGLGLALWLALPPVYNARAQIMIADGARQDRLLGGLLESEVAIAQSVPVLSKVAGRLNLYRDPVFARTGFLARIFRHDRDESAAAARVMGRLRRMISVHVHGGTSIIDMDARAADPARAAQIANALLASYQERKVDERFEQSRQIGAWMGKRLESIKAEGDSARQALGDIRVAHVRLAPGGADLSGARITLLNGDIARTQNDIATLSAQLGAIKKDGGSGPATLVEVLKSPRISALKKSESRLEDELAQMSERYGDLHPKIIAKKAEITRMRRAIVRETQLAVTAIGQNLEAAKAKLSALESQVATIDDNIDFDSRLQEQTRTLESQIAANDRLYADFMMKYQEEMAQSELAGADIRVISMATVPERPDNAVRARLVLLLAAVGFAGGFLFVLSRILLARGFTTADQLEAMTGYPVLAAVPLASARTPDGVHHSVMQNPAAILAESLRGLRISLRLRSEMNNEAGGRLGRRARVIAFTSTLPDEGKTSLAVMLAMIAAKAGERVCVVDCDLRRPSVHKAFRIGNARGLTDYLGERLDIDDAIYRKDPSGVHLLAAKAVPSYSLTLLTSGRMETLIETLREQYDLVILDAPSSLAFVDSRVLARMVDQTLYVVAWNRTRRDTVLAALKPYADMGYAGLSLVLNKVDLDAYCRDSAAGVVYRYGQEGGEDGSLAPA